MMKDPEKRKMKTDRTGRYDTARMNTAVEEVSGFKALWRNKSVRYAVFALIAALILTVAAFSLRQINDNKEYKQYYTAGQEHYYNRDYESALGYLRKASNIEARDDCLVLMADCYTSMGNYEKALEVLQAMDINDANVKSRISKVYELIAQREDSEKISIAGKQYTVNTTSVILNSNAVDNAVLEELTQLYALESLSLADNRISDVSALSSLGGLVTLELSRNSISSIAPLSALTGLRTLYLDANPITDFTPLYALKNLATLSIKDIEITEKQLADLSAALPGCAIHCEEATADVLEITLGGRTFSSDVVELDLSGLAISDISSLSNCKNLITLNLSNNNIYDISPLMDIPELSNLNIANNTVSDLRPLMGIRNLRYLYAANNYISSTVPLGAASALFVIDLSNNAISDFSGLKKLTGLNTLKLNNTGLTNEMLPNLYTLSSLAVLDISNNDALTGEGVDKLKIAISQCVITHSELAYSIVIGDRSFRNTDTVIDVSGLGVSDISPLGAFHAPEIVNLSNNQISNIYILQNVSSIKTLNLASNMLSDITPISTLNWLEVLDISNNLVTDITPLLGLTNLKSLNLSGNTIEDTQLELLRSMLPGCSIYY